MIQPDLGVEADSILGFVGVGLFAYGLGSKNFGIAAVGAGLAGWFGGLALARVGGIVAAVHALSSSIVQNNQTDNTNSSSQGTP